MKREQPTLSLTGGPRPVTWRALRPFGVTQGMLCASHRFSEFVMQMSTENFKISLARFLPCLI